ncbi:MAG: hypothetical protein KJO87_08065, partial [Acidimicrobiia bacterium]|nr:hypothetical protein [Acidimicrobiia bacterium]
MRRKLLLLAGSIAMVVGMGNAAPGADAVSHLMMFDAATGQWFMNTPEGSIHSFYYGTPGDVPLLGDWDCDGTETVGAYRPTTGFVYVRDTNDFGVADHEFYFGVAGDVPVAGDWDGDGCDTVSIYRDGSFYINNVLETAFAEYSFHFGGPGDVPFAGDFDGDGTDGVGVHRPSSGQVFVRNELTLGDPDVAFYYGALGDVILSGDWDEDGVDTVGVYRPSMQQFFLSNDPVGASTSHEVAFGSDGWVAAGHAAPGLVFDVAVLPGDDIQAAVDANPPGTTFLIRTGVHRNQSIRPKDGQVFVGEPGAVLNGSEVITGFAPDGPWWSAGGQTHPPLLSGHCEPGFPRCTHTNDLFVDGVT